MIKHFVVIRLYEDGINATVDILGVAHIMKDAKRILKEASKRELEAAGESGAWLIQKDADVFCMEKVTENKRITIRIDKEII